jgi:hypothetical protein
MTNFLLYFLKKNSCPTKISKKFILTIEPRNSKIRVS